MPIDDTDLPDAVRDIVSGREHRQVWHNELGGRTFAVTSADGTEYVKWAPHGSGVELAEEATRLRWAAPFTTVPEVRYHGADEHGSWLVTTALPGANAVTDRWTADPATTVAVLGTALRAMHDALPVAHCPFSWSVDVRLQGARRLDAAGRLDPHWHDEFAGLGHAAAFDRLEVIPATDQLVVCHGDACAPNTLIGADGSCTGHVDLGRLGVADRWADLAVATWSATWNYGREWEDRLLDAYGVDRDPERIEYYRLLWDLSPV